MNKKDLKITVLVPVYNNEKTIRHVLEILLSCRFLSKVIAVNDGSLDSSLQILNQLKKEYKHNRFEILELKKNHGKGAALERGFGLVKTPLIMIIDADLASLTKKHVFALYQAFLKSDAQMVIAARRYNFDSKLRHKLVDHLSGERIFYKKNIESVREFLKTRNQGFEQAVNFAHRNKKVKMIYAENTGHIMKFRRYSRHKVYKIPWAYISEGCECVKTYFLLKYYSFKKKFK
jgi:polyisoprenyl-phosphate glycosyltransferase